MPKKLYGLVGYAGSGKDTVANIMVNEFDFVRDSFAKTLKDACASIFNWPRHLLEGDTKESREFRETIDMWWAESLGMPNFTPREALKLMGTDVLRLHFHDKIWMLGVERRFHNNNKSVVVTDCRFKNEIAMIRKLGGRVIRVKRGSEPSWYDTALLHNLSTYENDDLYENVETMFKELNVHPSERDWIGSTFDAIIENDGTLEELECQTKQTILSLN